MLKNLVLSSLRRSGLDVVRVPRGTAASLVQPAGIYRIESSGVRAEMLVLDPQDSIQRDFVAGRFYESDEIEIIKAHLKGDVFVDIGANVGNHTVFFGTMTSISTIVSFEPNPAAFSILSFNVVRNGLTNKTLLNNFGLSDAEQSLELQMPKGNLGGAQLVKSAEPGTFPVRLKRGDDVLGGLDVGFIKIDVERHELECLNGLRSTIARCQPHFFVESVVDTREGVRAFFKTCGYSLAETFERYAGYYNDVFLPE